MRKILVLRGGALGDFIVTLPALALLRARWPAARIELAGNATAAALARARGLLDAAHSQHEARWSALFGREPLPATFGAWLSEFDLVINYWPDPDGELHRRFPLRSGQTFLSATALPADGAPAAVHYCRPLRELGLVRNDYFYSLLSPPSHGPSETIAIHPGSGATRKNWPMARWRELISRLDTSVLLILGEAERRAEWNGLSATGVPPVGSAWHSGLRLAIELPLEELIAELSRCRLFLGHDSGIGHLAAACGVPSILLFGPTDPVIWAPPAPHVTVLRRAGDLNAITVAEVLAAAISRRTPARSKSEQ